MGMHGDLFEGAMPPQARTSPPWPGRPVPVFVSARRKALWTRLRRRG